MALQPNSPQQQTQTATNTAKPPEFDPEAWLDAQIAKADRYRGQINLTEDGVAFGDFAGVQRYARMLILAQCVPVTKDDYSEGVLYKGEFLFDKVLARVTLCMLLGRRVGLPPEESVASIYVVGNRTQIFGDAPLAIARQHPLWVEAGYKEYFEVWDGKAYVAVKGNPAPEQFKVPTTRCVVETLRKGASEPKVHTYSIADAIAAGVMSNAQYGKNPHRMLRFRARGHNLRDNFGDALKGLGISEVDDAEAGAGAETAKETPTLPSGSLDLRTLNVSPPVAPVPPVPPVTKSPPPPVASVPPTTAKTSKKPTDLPKPPESKPQTDPLTVAIEELNLFHPNAYSDWLGKRGAVPEDVEDSTGEKRAEWVEDLNREIRRLSTAE
jgi:hypothetical protein